MDSIDPLVSALISLCKTEGGEAFVADKAKVSAANLLQIIRGVKLPSGNPRGVGPVVRQKISAAYPGWLSIGITDPIGPGQDTGLTSKQTKAYLGQANTATESISDVVKSVSIEAALQLLGEELMPLDATTRRRVGALLSDLANDPSDHQNLAALLRSVINLANRKAG